MATSRKGGQRTPISHLEGDRLWEDRFTELYAAKREQLHERLERRRAQAQRARRRTAKAEGRKPYVEPTGEEMARIILERDAHHERRREICEHFDREQLVARHAARKQAIAKRINEGFVWDGGHFGGETARDGYWRDRFKAEGFRSDEHAIYKLFVAKVHRAHKGLKVGTLKSVIDGTQSKLLALDEPIVTFNETMRGVMRVDVDGTFPSVAAMYQALNEVKAPWPNIVVGFRDETGAWVNPHFYYLLEHSVCFTEKGDPRHIKLFNAIERGLVHGLLRLGADPGGLANSLRGKNPLSPLWDAHVIRDEPWSMDELKDRVKLNVSREHLVRLAAEILEPVVVLKDGKKLPSNSFFTRLQEHACGIVAAHHKAGDYEQFAAEMQLHALGLCGDYATVKEKTLRAVAQRVTDYVWAQHKPGARPHKVRPGRGHCHHEVQGKTLTERQQIGAHSTNQRRSDATLERLAAAYRQLVEAGEKPTQKAVLAIVEPLGIKGIATVKRRWTDVLEAIGEEGIIRCIDKKLALLVVGEAAAPQAVSCAPSVAAIAPLPVPLAPADAAVSGIAVVVPVERPGMAAPAAGQGDFDADGCPPSTRVPGAAPPAAPVGHASVPRRQRVGGWGEGAEIRPKPQKPDSKNLLSLLQVPVGMWAKVPLSPE